MATALRASRTTRSGNEVQMRGALLKQRKPAGGGIGNDACRLSGLDRGHRHIDVMMFSSVERNERVRMARMRNAMLLAQEGLRINRQPFLAVHSEDCAAAQ